MLKKVIEYFRCPHPDSVTLTNFNGDYIDKESSFRKIYRSKRYCKICGKIYKSEYYDPECKVINYNNQSNI